MKAGDKGNCKKKKSPFLLAFLSVIKIEITDFLKTRGHFFSYSIRGKAYVLLYTQCHFTDIL